MVEEQPNLAQEDNHIKEESKKPVMKKARLLGVGFDRMKPLPFADLAPSSDQKPSLQTLTEESLRTSKLITSQLATSIDF
jgi:hypothetical protein